MAPNVLPKLRCAGVTADAKGLWAEERETPSRAEPSLWRTMMRLCSRDLIIGTLASSFQGVLSTILRPIVLAMLIQTIQKQRLGQVTTAEAVVVVLFFASISFADNMTKVFAFQKVNVASSARYTAGATSLIFHKLLTAKLNLGDPATNAPVDGKSSKRRAESIVNLVGTDVIGLKEQVMVIGMIAWAVVRPNYTYRIQRKPFRSGPRFYSRGAPAQVGGIGAVVMIIATIGWVAGLVGLFVNVAFTFITGRLSFRLKNVEKQRTAASDKRMQTLGQLIEGMHHAFHQHIIYRCTFVVKG